MNISQEYVKELRTLHEKKSFGISSKIPAEVINCIEKYYIKSLLDFGCGKGLTLAAVKSKYPDIDCHGYDPGREGFNSLPNSVDLIYSSDVLEHIEPHLLDKTLIDLHNRTTKCMYHLIACHPAKKGLSDGRNAHLIIESPEWWRKKLKELNFKIVRDEVKEYTTQPKKGPELLITKYIVIIEK